MTYVAAIYEYNLSVRQDYDRDVMRKKATAVFYKFDIQHTRALNAIGFVTGLKKKSDGVTPVDSTFPQPNMIFANSYDKCQGISACKNNNYHSTTLFFKSGDDYVPIFLRPECEDCLPCDGTREDCSIQSEDGTVIRGASSIDYGDDGSYYQRILMTPEQSFYGEDEMASKLLCLSNNLYDEYEGLEIKDCESPKDDEGRLMGSCCSEDGIKKALVSYKTVDPRWLNRISNGISMDFWRAIENRRFYTNLGIIQWDEKQKRWVFRGKTGLYAAYYQDDKKWKEQEAEIMENDPNHIEKRLPRYMRYKTTWVLPEYFGEDFFKSMDGQEMCKKNGCIFRLNEF